MRTIVKLAVLLSVSIPITAEAEEKPLLNRAADSLQAMVVDKIIAIMPVPVHGETRDGFIGLGTPVTGPVNFDAGRIPGHKVPEYMRSNNPYAERMERAKAVLGVRFSAHF